MEINIPKNKDIDGNINYCEDEDQDQDQDEDEGEDEDENELTEEDKNRDNYGDINIDLYPNKNKNIKTIDKEYFLLRVKAISMALYSLYDIIYEKYKQNVYPILYFPSYSKFYSTGVFTVNFITYEYMIDKYINFDKGYIINIDNKDYKYFTVFIVIKNEKCMMPIKCSRYSEDEINKDDNNNKQHSVNCYCFGCKKFFNKELNICSKCHIIFYCSKKCQIENWSEHKNNCNKQTIYYRCANCNCYFQNKLKKCSRCKSIEYCSKQCQKQHWIIHKKICNDD